MPTIKRLPRRQSNYTNPESGRRAERHAIYDTQRWRDLRAAKFVAQPLCEVCLAHGIVTPAEDIHHRISFMTAPAGPARQALAYDYDNLMSLCRSCHLIIHHRSGEQLDGGMG